MHRLLDPFESTFQSSLCHGCSLLADTHECISDHNTRNLYRNSIRGNRNIHQKRLVWTEFPSLSGWRTSPQSQPLSGQYSANMSIYHIQHAVLKAVACYKSKKFWWQCSQSQPKSLQGRQLQGASCNWLHDIEIHGLHIFHMIHSLQKSHEIGIAGVFQKKFLGRILQYSHVLVPILPKCVIIPEDIESSGNFFWFRIWSCVPVDIGHIAFSFIAETYGNNHAWKREAIKHYFCTRI
jgi:hypothetical protein